MSYSGDAAEQVVRMSLEGAEVAARITGRGAKEIAILLYAVLKDQKKTKGKTRLSNMLRSGKELKVFAVQDKDLMQFCKEAKKYGVLYCVLKDRDATDGITDVMVRAEDTSKVNRIFERFALTTVDMASVRSEVERAKANRPGETPETLAPKRSREDIFLDALMNNPSTAEQQAANPTQARTAPSSQSVPISEGRQSTTAFPGNGPNPDDAKKRPSVRQELKDIRDELDRKAKQRKMSSYPLEHHVPKKKRKFKIKEK